MPDQLRTLQAAIRKGGPSNADAELAHGDFYVTKHSNLADVQVVFHLAAVEQEVMLCLRLCQPFTAFQLSSDSFNTRSPTIAGLRNIIRYAFQNNIYTLTLPLLLVTELTEVAGQHHHSNDPTHARSPGRR